MTVIGFVGLGVMGKPMARNVSRVFKVLVYDLDPERVQQTLTEKPEGSGSLHAADSVRAVGASAAHRGPLTAWIACCPLRRAGGRRAG